MHMGTGLSVEVKTGNDIAVSVLQRWDMALCAHMGAPRNPGDLHTETGRVGVAIHTFMFFINQTKQILNQCIH